MSSLLLPLTELRSKLGSLTQLLKQHKTITLTFRGKPVAVVRQYAEETPHQQQSAWGVLHDSSLEPTEYSTVKLPTWLYMQYQQQAVESQLSIAELINRTLQSQVQKNVRPTAKKQRGMQDLIKCAEELHKKYAKDLEKVPRDISTNYKQYLYGGKK